jgi:hypothetical protein
MGSVFENYAQEDYEEGGVHYEAVFTQLTTDQKLLIRVIFYQNLDKDRTPSIDKIIELDNDVGNAVKNALIGLLSDFVGMAITSFDWACDEFEPKVEDIYNLHLRDLIEETDFSEEREYFNYLRRHLRSAKSDLANDIIRECQEIDYSEEQRIIDDRFRAEALAINLANGSDE